MNIIFLDWPCFCRNAAIKAFEKLGHQVTTFIHPEYAERKSPAFHSAFTRFLQNGSYDMLFSFNFFPVVSEECKLYKLPYISFVYDSPHVSLYSYTVIYPCNSIFLFDKSQYQELHNMGIPTIHYLPLAGDPDGIQELLSHPHDQSRYQADISFVGTLYNEDHNFFDRLTGLSDYSRGYLKAIMEAQLKVYGYYFIEEVLTPDIISEMKASLNYEAGNSGVQTDEYIYSNYFIGRKLTEMDRIRTLTSVSKCHSLSLYTLNTAFQRPGITNKGTVDYDSEMPYVFHYSKINLNITLKSIKSGIPLRAIDIMSAGGFLLTNFQADFLDYFVPDVDFVYYNDLKDLNEKVDYYLNHEEERCQIARNGYEKICRYHTFTKRFSQILQIVFPKEESQ